MATSNPLVLVADDEPSMLELVARHLRLMSSPKLEVIQASDGEEAWRLAREHLPDLVVLDVMMPGMSGWEVCRKIREDVALAHTGVVMLTGIGENLNQMTSPLYGADAYIDKPFEFDDFDDKIRDTLQARVKQREGVVRPPINGAAAAAKPMSAGEGRVSRSPKPAPAKRAKGAPAKKTAASAAPAKRAPAKRVVAAKAAPAKRTPAKKAPARTALAKKAPARTAPAKKASAKKASAKKASAKKAPARTAPAKRPSAKKVKK